MEVNPLQMVEKTESLEKEIRELRAENKARREMWNYFKDIYGGIFLKDFQETIKQIMEDFEQKYGGGE